MGNETQFYTTADIRRLLKIGNKKCLELFHRSDFPCVKFGKSFLITVEAFNNYVSSRRVFSEANE